jgi:ABC-2 type transport system permease protein
MNAVGRTGTLLTAYIGYGWATFCVLLGLGGLLYHAVSDRDMQVRRTYMALGYAFLGVGVLLSFLALTAQYRSMFLPFGVLGWVVGLLFLLAFVRHEDEAKWHDPAVYVIGGAGVLLGLVGFIFSNVSLDFLLPYGLVVLLVGLVYWWTFVSLTGASSNLGYGAALGMGAVGLLGFLVALGRSLLPSLFASWGWTGPAVPYLMPAGLLLMSAGLVYLVVSAALWSDNVLVVLTRRELAAFFFSPIAYILLFGFSVVAWYSFAQFVNQQLLRPLPVPGMGQAMQVFEPIIAFYIISLTPVMCVVFVVPVLTMRLLSEEKRTGTIEVMLTAPLDETALVVSKFLAAFIFFMLVWLPFALYLIALRGEGGQAFDYRPLLSFYIALAASGAGFISMGLFFSSVTRSQVAAAILAFIGMLLPTFLYLLKLGWPRDSFWAVVITHISYIDLWLHALEGNLAPRDLVYHLSAAVFWLFLTVKVLESRKWR